MSDPTGALPRSDGGFVIEHSTVDDLVERLVDTAESLSAGFDQALDEAVDYADWMGTKHLSAVEVSTREAVLAAITLSEENGRVTVFRNGTYEDRKRHELGGRWRGTR